MRIGTAMLCLALASCAYDEGARADSSVSDASLDAYDAATDAAADVPCGAVSYAITHVMQDYDQYAYLGDANIYPGDCVWAEGARLECHISGYGWSLTLDVARFGGSSLLTLYIASQGALRHFAGPGTWSVYYVESTLFVVIGTSNDKSSIYLAASISCEIGQEV